MSYTECPYCHRIANEHGLILSKEIGNPIIRCNNCGKLLADDNIYEWGAISKESRLNYCLFSNYRIAIHWFAFILPASIMANSSFFAGVICLILIEAILSPLMYYSVVSDNSGEIEKSIKRVQNPEYIDNLAALGYDRLDPALYNDYRERKKNAGLKTDKNYDKKQELQKRITDLKKALKESDESYETNKKILSEAYSDEELEQMVARGQFPADKVKEYIEQRHNLEMIIDFMPSARKDLVRWIGDASKELAELECE